MKFEDFSAVNRSRCESRDGFGHKLGDWSFSDWGIAAVGELGEAANVIKKLNRVRDDIPGNKETTAELTAKLKSEIGDTLIYLDLFCQALGTDMETVMVESFNAKSREKGMPFFVPGKTS